MKKLFIIIIIFISFQSLSKADDISDFQIEGISVGDSLLKHAKTIGVTKEYILDKDFRFYPGDDRPSRRHRRGQYAADPGSFAGPRIFGAADRWYGAPADYQDAAGRRGYHWAGRRAAGSCGR